MKTFLVVAAILFGLGMILYAAKQTLDAVTSQLANRQVRIEAVLASN